MDAECTHDGSIAHVKKYGDMFASTDFDANVLDEERMTRLETLQRSLILRGFDLLKDGGTMVYSTCSFCTKQNEDIVMWLLMTRPDARLAKIEDAQRYPCVTRDGAIMRFDPKRSNTSALFIAKVMKQPTNTCQDDH